MATAREKLVEATVGKVFQSEKVSLMESAGRILAESVISPAMVPDFRRSTVDGYAVHAGDTWGADENAPVFLELVEEVNMGDTPKKALKPGECVYVPTGAMLPECADGMVMVEYCEAFAVNQIAIHQGVAKGSFIVEIGEDLQLGEEILQAGKFLGPGDIAVLASLGISEVCVYQKPKITIISTGDELATPGEEKKMGQVYEINSFGLCAMAMEKGLDVVHVEVVQDTESLLLIAVKKAMAKSDFVVVSGGSSQGKQDITKQVLDEVSCPGVFTHGIAFKPGKPTILGYDAKSETILVGLPGHPVAAMMVFELVILWYYRQKLGIKEGITVPAFLESNLPGAPGRETCQLVELILDKKQDFYIARPILGKSGSISTLSRAVGYILIHRNKEGIKAGEKVQVHLL